jgi:hypothetical protein
MVCPLATIQSGFCTTEPPTPRPRSPAFTGSRAASEC